MNHAIVTFTGYLATTPERRQTTTGKRVTNVRVATTERRKQGDQYVDGVTTFYTVTCWNWLGERVADCLQKGDPVFVSGRLVEKSYQKKDGSGLVTYLDVEADAIGPDLKRVSVDVRRRPRDTAADSVPSQSSDASPTPVTPDPWASPLGQAAEPAA